MFWSLNICYRVAKELLSVIKFSAEPAIFSIWVLDFENQAWRLISAAVYSLRIRSC